MAVCSPSSRCMRFYYYFADYSHSAVLRAYVRQTEDGSGVSLNMNKTLLLTHTEDEEGSWGSYQAYIYQTGNFQVNKNTN